MVVLPDSVVPSSKVPIKDVNECITCHICKGYIIDATTIVECCHSFCHSCIVPHLRTKEYCPKCELIINKTKPNIKPDATFQAIVYKLVPGLYEKELLRRRNFYETRPEEAKLATPEQRGEDTEHLIFRPTEKISLSLEYAFIDEHKSRSPELAKPKYLQCPAIFPVSLLSKFVVMKFGIDSAQFNVDIMYKVKTIVLPEYYTLMDVAYIYTWKREAPMRFFFRVRTKETTSEELPEVPLRRSPSINNRQAPVAAGEAEVKEEHREDIRPAAATTKPHSGEQKVPSKQGSIVKKDISEKCIKVEKNVPSVVEKVVKVSKSSKKNYEDCVKSEKRERGDSVKVKKEKVLQVDGGKKCENIKLKIGLSKDNSKMMVIKDITPTPEPPMATSARKGTEKTTKSPKEKVPQVKVEKCHEMEEPKKDKPPTVEIPLQKTVKQEPKSPTTNQVRHHLPCSQSSPIKVEMKEKSPEVKKGVVDEIRQSPKTTRSPSPAKIHTETDIEMLIDLEEIKKSQFLNSFELTAKKADTLKSDGNKVDSVKADGIKASSLKTDKADSLKADKLKTDSNKEDCIKTGTTQADNHKAESLKADSIKTNSLKTDNSKTDANKAPTNASKTDSAASKRKNKDPVKSIAKTRLPELPNLISPPLSNKPEVKQSLNFDLSPFPVGPEKSVEKKPPVSNGFAVPKCDVKKPKKDESTVPRRKYTNFVKIAPKQASSTAASLMNSAAFIGGSGTSKLSMRSSSTPSRIAPPRRQSVATENPSRILQDTFSMLQKNSTEIKKIDGTKDVKVYGPQMGPPPTPAGLPMPRTPNHVPDYWNFPMRNGSSKGYIGSPYLGLSSPMYTPNYSPNSPQYAPTYNIPIAQSQFKYTGLPTNGTSGLPRTLGKGTELAESGKKIAPNEGESVKRAKSTSPTKDDGEPPEKQRKVQSLLDSCNITFPSSLSITLTNEQNDMDTSKSTKTPKPKRPVNNYIEILKLPSDGATTVTPIPPEDTRNGKVSPKDTGKGKDLLTKVNELTTKAAETSKKIDGEAEKKKQVPKLNPIDKPTPPATTEGGSESFQQTYLMSLLTQSVYKDAMQNKLYDLKTNKIISLDGVSSSTSPENRPSPPPPKKSKSEPSSLVKSTPKEDVKPTKSASALDLSSVTSSVVEGEKREKKSPKETKKSSPRHETPVPPKIDLTEPTLSSLLPSLPLIPPATPTDLMTSLNPGFPNPLNYPVFWMEQYQRMKKAGSEALELYFQNIQKNIAKAKGMQDPSTTSPPPTTVSSTVSEAEK
ncbi:polycomb group protein Psc [Lutzomyia longipalpis]|uniref:polycomb group protein Psc n=1 Tax=Lutzomyia longipalpis TaxID=7200 RepID=UPI0024846E92|nr:polycomb group protein Psc [Lutzomyia longipalpis]